jgi:hypothetical protein
MFLLSTITTIPRLLAAWALLCLIFFLSKKMRLGKTKTTFNTASGKSGRAMSSSIFNRESKIIENATRIFNWTLQILKNNKNRHSHLNLHLLTVKIHIVALFSYINIVVLMYGVHYNHWEYLKM